MNIVIMFFAALIVLASLSLVAQPRQLLGWMDQYQDSWVLYLFAILVRVVLGVMLLAVASQSRFPTTLHVLAWIFLIAAVVIIAMGRTRFSKLIAWASGFEAIGLRVAGVFAGIFGGFLLYAVW